MFTAIFKLFETEGFPARWHCGTAWQEQPAWGWLHIYSDLSIWLAYMAIPVVLFYFLRSRRDIPLPRILMLFGAFIFCCGLTHLIDALIFDWPIYRFAGVMKLITGIVSWGTVLALIGVVPRVLNFRSPEELERTVTARTVELQDLTERLREQVDQHSRISDELAEQKEILRFALESGGMGVWEWNLESDTVHYDATHERLTGFRREGNTMPIADFMERVHPQDRDGLKQATQQAIRGRAVYNHEFRFETFDHGYRWLSGRGSVVTDEHGQPLFMRGVHFDVTARKEAEEVRRIQTRAMEFTQSGILIASAEPDEPLVYCNPAFNALTGYSYDEAFRRNCRFLQGPDTNPETVSRIREAIAQRAECHEIILNYRKDGSTFWNDLHISPVFDEQGTVTHFVGFLNDVTGRIEYEEELINARAEADAANLAKSVFLASMSHEIRTPMTSILGCANLLYDQIEEQGPREIVRMLRDQGELLLGILNDILDLSKIEAGRLEIHHEKNDLGRTLEEIYSLMHPLAIEHGLELKIQYLTPLPRAATFDALRLRQILLNLISNAIKFTEAGFVEIAVACQHETPSRDFELRIEVRDTGVGISREDLGKIFDAFVQAKQTDRGRSAGTGLGLTISQRLVDLMGGTIHVRSEVGQGSQFTLRLPLGWAEESEDFETQPHMTAAPHQFSRSLLDALQPLRILIAEDTSAIQFLLRKLLESRVTEICIVSNGQEAFDTISLGDLNNPHFDVILMDMQMPVMNGFEATRKLRDAGCEIPIIALTAGAMSGDREYCLRCGCTDYLSKPISLEKLLVTIRRCTKLPGTSSDYGDFMDPAAGSAEPTTPDAD